MKKDKLILGIGFRFMAFMFRFRDMVNPPEKYLKETKMKEGDKILDYGCGPGSFVFPAAKIVREKGKIYAADLHPVAIKTIEKKAKRRKMTNVEVIQTNCATGLSSKSIDIILMYDVIHMFKKPDEIFEEMHRVLKQEGILSVANPHIRERDIITKIENNSDFRLIRKGDKTFTFKKNSTKQVNS